MGEGSGPNSPDRTGQSKTAMRLQPASCESPECPVCELKSRLIQGGAKSVDWLDLYEHDCHVYLRTGSEHGCVHGLRLDVPDAKYRRLSKGKTRRMCDFSVLAMHSQNVLLVAVELKSGAAYTGDLEQLAEGLRLLHDCFKRAGLMVKPSPRACFVVGRELDKFRSALRGELTRLRFGPLTVRLEILECGESLHL